MLTLLGLALVAAAAVAVAFWRIADTAQIPAAEELERPDPTVLLDDAGEQVEALDPADVQENVALEDLPDHVPAAVLAAEDRRFGEHGGYSARGIVRAAWANVRAGTVEQGASTIHQQYVAMAIEDIDDSYEGKFREAAIASRLDDEFSDERILEMYLNQVPFGRAAHGIDAAARTYFDVPATELDEEQASVLAGMIAAPSAYDPADNPDGAAARRDFVLDGMQQTGAMDPATAQELQGSDLPSLRDEPLVSLGDDAWFLDTVRQELPELLDGQVEDVTDGLVVYTTLDRGAQASTAAELRDHLDGHEASGSSVSIEPGTGAVRALVGGPDFEVDQFNVATDAQRQVGSTFKTFALLELVARGYDPDLTDIDAPEEYEIEVEDGDDATVGNYSGRGHGEVDVREATVDSLNTPYAQLGEELGAQAIAERARDLGVTSELSELPSMVLGAADLRPLELTAAYATIAAEGTRHEPYLIERIERHDGEVLYDHEPDGREVVDPEAAHVVTDVLTDAVEHGTGQAAALDRPVAGKTGTTNEGRDAWFVGYTPQLTTSVWVGKLDNTPMDGEVTGGGLPAEIFRAAMIEMLDGADADGFPDLATGGLQAFEELEPEEDEDLFARDPEDDGREEDAPDEDDESDEDDDSDEDEDDGEDDGEGDDGDEADEADDDGDDGEGDEDDGEDEDGDDEDDDGDDDEDGDGDEEDGDDSGDEDDEDDDGNADD